jgi:hypothetical protein
MPHNAEKCGIRYSSSEQDRLPIIQPIGFSYINGLGLGPKLLGYRDAAPCPRWEEYLVTPTTYDILWAPTSYRTGVPVLQPIQFILIKTFLLPWKKCHTHPPKELEDFSLNYSSPLGMAVSARLELHKKSLSSANKRRILPIPHSFTFFLLLFFKTTKGSTSPKRRKLALGKNSLLVCGLPKPKMSNTLWNSTDPTKVRSNFLIFLVFSYLI